jgi:SAM-dependent methyltransferase
MNNQHLWTSGDLYERYAGRWSRLVAVDFLSWLSSPPNLAWLDVGCGTGALSQSILDAAMPVGIRGFDRSEGFVQFAREKVRDAHTVFEVGDAQDLPVKNGEFDVAVSGLVLNFVPEPEKMVLEMARAVRKDGWVALYVWDYAGKMQFMRHFFNAASALDPAAVDLDEGRRFPICNPNALSSLFRKAGLKQVESHPIDIDTDFKNFEDFWSPFLGGQGPAPGYAMSLSEEKRAQLRDRIRAGLPFALDGSIPLVARAWAVRGSK